MEQPSWLAEAWRELGQREVAGEDHNPRITALFRDAGHAEVVQDEIAWCAAFDGACLQRAGESGTGSLLARSYLDWGIDAGPGRLGAVAVLSRGADPALGHVGFLIGATAAELFLLGGNQDDAVTVSAYARTRLLGLRWPTPATDADDGGFANALAHVLKMEGGYTNDPYDPGGPTNKGITLAVLAAWHGVTLDAGSRAGLIAELKQIPDPVVRAIYLARYWQPAHCPELSAPLAFMHFDTAVNHGVGAATRMLQEAVGAEADGEIGPETRAAIARTEPAAALAAYADIRRRRYRALPHFWRFGRGWLARVDKTLARSRALLPATPADAGSRQSQQQQKGDKTMQTEAKWWGQSVTIWGALITALSTVVPALGPVLGIDITGDLVREAGEQIVLTVQAIAGLIGTLLTIYGRVRASQPIERRDVAVKL